MTWHTPDGTRRLTGTEAELVRESLAVIVDHLSEDLQYAESDDQLRNYGVALFDELTGMQRLALIWHVATHLLNETSDTLELTAVNEAAAYAIFQNIAAEIQVEIDVANDRHAEDETPGMRTYWRQRVLNAYKESVANEQDDAEEYEAYEFCLPEVENEDISEWLELTESLADRILWDRDFEMEERFLDTEPLKAKAVRQLLGINADYYTAVAPDVREEGVKDLLHNVRRITRGA